MAGVSRRGFLKTAGAVSAAVLSAPMFIPARALGKEGDIPAPSNRLTLGSIGVANQGGALQGQVLGNGGVQLLAVCDVDEPTRLKAKDRTEQRYGDALRSGRYKGCDPYMDFRELLARKDIDAVLIAVPDHWHALIAVAAAKAGKDIYCEKPLALTIREGRAMVDSVRRYGRVLQTGSMQRSSQEFRTACEAVRNGRIGKIKTVHVNVSGPSGPCTLPSEPIPPGMNWDMWMGPAPYRGFHKQIHPYNWRNFRDYSGGGMTDWGAHHFDIAQWALGMDDTGPVEITPPNGKDVKNLTYRYANGTLMYHAAKIENHPPGREVREAKDPNEVYGVLFTGETGSIEVNRGYIKGWPDEVVKAPLRPDEMRLYKSTDHMGDWIDCIKTRRRPITDVEIGHRSATVCHLGNIAYWLKRPLQWDPGKEDFVDDAEASRWLSRPYRGEWAL